MNMHESQQGKLKQHLNSDPQPQCQLEGLQFTVIECLFCKKGKLQDKFAGNTSLSTARNGCTHMSIVPTSITALNEHI